jgi:hypothetical protein
MAISNTVLTTSISNVYVSSGNSVVSVMYFYNDNASTRDFSLFLVPSGTSTIDSTVQIYGNVQVTAYDTFVIDLEKLVLGNGDTIRANASANTSVTASVSYVGI